MKRDEKQLDICIRTMTELRTKADVLAKDVYFEGGDILRCCEGRFEFELDGVKPIEICAGETLVTYPGQRVTIKALDKHNAIFYAVFHGKDVANYFDSFGFFDGLHGITSEQRIPFESVKVLFEEGENFENPRVRALLVDALTTYAHDFCDNGMSFVLDAVRQIRENLANRIVQIKPLCERLRVSRSYLHRMFVCAGIGSPSEFIRREQLRLIRKYLKDPALTIADVAALTGFLSQTHFADFVKRYTGHTARELRR